MALKEDTKGKGPIEIDGVDARHPVPYKDGFPTVDDCYNTAYDFAVPCRFASGTEFVITSGGGGTSTAAMACTNSPITTVIRYHAALLERELGPRKRAQRSATTPDSG